MLRFVIDADVPVGHSIGVKESLAMDVEKYGGDVRVVSVEVREPEQMRIGGSYGGPA